MKKDSTRLELGYQVEGTQFLRARRAAALFDEQGLGKSKQVIDAIAQEIAAGDLGGVLVVCPNGLKSNWAKEVEKFSNLKYAVFGSGQSARRIAFRSLRAAVYIINYEAVLAEMSSLRALLRFKSMAIVLDESHRIKTPDAKITQAILALRALAQRRYILSGTPVANRPEDLWAQLLFLDDGEALGASFDRFRQLYRSGNVGYRNLGQLRDRVAGLSLRRTKANSLALPSKQYVRISVTLAGIQADMYEGMREELELWVKGMDGSDVLARGEAILARLVRLAQLASNPALLDASYSETPGKFQALDTLLAEYERVNPTQKVIVWTSFVGNIRALVNRYGRWNPVAIHGETSNEARDEAVRSFTDEAETRMLVANPAAAREGLTLTKANVAIYLDRTFNLVDYLQSQDRIHRLSQTRACEIVILVARDTVDEFIDFSIEQKHRLAQFAQNDTKTVDDDDLALRKPALLRALLAPGTSPVAK
jgi:SNF2 family DNA or RNA helicase